MVADKGKAKPAAKAKPGKDDKPADDTVILYNLN